MTYFSTSVFSLPLNAVPQHIPVLISDRSTKSANLKLGLTNKMSVCNSTVNSKNLITPIIICTRTTPLQQTTAPVSIGLLNVRSLVSKSFICRDFIEANNLDLFFITESWLCPGDLATLNDTCPPNFLSFNHPRLSGRAGGLAVIYKENIKGTSVNFGTFSSFEIFSVLLKGKLPILFVLIYRPPKLTGFLDEFAELLSVIMPQYDRLCILGDFNIHVCCPSSAFVTDFITLYESFNLVQHITGSTHSKGHTLDLLLSHGLPLNNLNVVDFPPSDHKAILFQSLFPIPTTLPPKSYRARSFKPNSSHLFKEAFPAVAPISPPPVQLSVDALVNDFNSTCTHILDSIAPFKIKLVQPKSGIWENEHTRGIRKLN